MHNDGKKLLQLMFKPGERICPSPNQFGYHSIALEEVLASSSVTLIPTVDSCVKRKIVWESSFEQCPTEKLLLVSLNPMNMGWREDANCSAFRNFLVELDDMPLEKQKKYIDHTNLPFSASIFSGGKSLHYLISLDTDLPSENVWRTFAEWILNILSLADPMTKNPSRSIRIPGALREDKGKYQRLVEFKGKVKLQDLVTWLKQYPNAKPVTKEKRERDPNEKFDMSKLKGWVIKALDNGIDHTRGRNRQWYAIAYEFALSGYSQEECEEILEQRFQPDRDFKRREFLTCIKSAYKTVYEKR